MEKSGKEGPWEKHLNCRMTKHRIPIILHIPLLLHKSMVGMYPFRNWPRHKEGCPQLPSSVRQKDTPRVCACTNLWYPAKLCNLSFSRGGLYIVLCVYMLLAIDFSASPHNKNMKKSCGVALPPAHPTTRPPASFALPFRGQVSSVGVSSSTASRTP